MRLLFGCLLVVGTLSCSSGAEPVSLTVTIQSGPVLLNELGQSATISAAVRDAGGAVVAGALTWSSDDPAVVSIDPASGRLTSVGAGRTRVRARTGSAEGSTTVEVYLAPDWAFAVGESSFGRNDYVEYVVGDLPLVISAPHGGYDEPDEIAVRTFGVMGQDRNTQEMARAISDEIFRRVGRRPHLIINRLHRNRFDANREIVEASQGDPFSEQAFREYEELIDSAQARVVAATGTGLFVDLHGHGHEIQRIELGYLLGADDLGRTDAAIDAGPLVATSSIRRLAENSPTPFSDLLRGAESMGGMLQNAGVRSVPSPSDPSPMGAPYFTGGYNTRVHGSRDGGPLDGIQFELHWSGLRENEQGRAQFAQAFASVVSRYMETHFGLDWETLP